MMSKEYFKTIIDCVGDPIFVKDQQYKLVFVNNVGCKLIGMPRERLIGKTDYELFPKEQADVFRMHDTYVFETGEKDINEEAITDAHGNVGIIITTKTLYISKTFEKYIVGTIRDITEHKRAEKALKQSEELFRTLVEESSEVIVLLDHDMKRMYVSQSVERILGYSVKEFFSVDRDDYIHPDFIDISKDNRRWATEHPGEPVTFTSRVRHKNGSWRWVEVTARSLVNDPVVRAFVIHYHDITRRKEAEDALRTSQLHLSEAMDLANIVYWEVDPADDVFIFNDLFYVFYGTTAEREGGYRMTREEYAKRFIHPDDQRAISLIVKQNITQSSSDSPPDLEHRIVRRDGEVRHILARASVVKDASGHIVKRYGANQDITGRKRAEKERIRLESQLLQAQKMEAMGVLAGGIAHDFNNVLEGIIGFAELIKEDSLVDSSQYRRIELVLKGARRGRDLVKQILTFSRQAKQAKKPAHLREIAEEGLKLIRPTLPSTIEIRLTCLTNDDSIYADSGQIHQVLMNLCTNAAHAMREKGGILDIHIANKVFSAFDHMVPHMIPGRYVMLAVRDTGCGMKPEIIERIFDPFFTTKRPGEGTGLGLSVVHGIIESHNGYMMVESEPRNGSTFSVFFPESERPASGAGEKALPVTGGKERILFVDDEDILVDLNRDRLNRLGYGVVTTTSSTEALELFKKEPDGFDLVITDYTMPYLTGLDLAAEFQKIRPDIPIIICTGYSDNLSRESAKSAGIREFLMKPIEKRELAEAIRRILDTQTEGHKG